MRGQLRASSLRRKQFFAQAMRVAAARAAKRISLILHEDRECLLRNCGAGSALDLTTQEARELTQIATAQVYLCLRCGSLK